MKFTLILLSVIVFAAPALSRRFTRCGLAQEMFRLGTPKSELAKWVCIADKESLFDTAAVGPPNTDGSQDHGIFQINDRYWCRPSDGKTSYNGCNISCSNLRTNDIRDSVICARKILKKQGWTAWSVYNMYCDGHLPSINNCF